MNYFYHPNIEANSFILEGDEFIHARRSLRLTAGSSIITVDGKGRKSMGRIDRIEKKKAVCTVDEVIENYNPLPYELNLYIAPTKNISRFEWMLEKCTEIGVTSINPILCSRSERKIVRLDRLEKVLVSAMKQSLKAHLPVLGFVQKYNAAISSKNTLKLLCTGKAESHLLEKYSKNQPCHILIGPEGDFTDEEIALAKLNGYEIVNLGAQRLRTETAGVVATSMIASCYR